VEQREARVFKRLLASRQGAGRMSAVLGLVTVLGVGLGACAADISARGNEPTRERLSQIEPGKQSRADVAALLGTPSTTATFDGDTWYYISAQTKRYAVFEREELERRVIAISFGDDGRVSEVRELGLADGRDVDVVQRETPTLGNELSIIEQLLGNLGRFEGDGGGGLTREIPGL
jgi:outer membrane protein assembly factor BamE (lipoprotein component of BamABCDE complex)